MVKHHGDITPQCRLYSHRVFRRHGDGIAVDVRLEDDLFFGDLGSIGQAENLKAAPVSEHGALPAGKRLQATEFFNDRFARPQSQMVGVPQDQLAASISQHLWREALDGSLSSHRHEDRGLDATMGCGEASAPGR